MTLLSLLSYWECPKCHSKSQFTKRQIENGIDECPKCGWQSVEKKDRIKKFAKMMTDLSPAPYKTLAPSNTPSKKDMMGIIKYLDEYFGRVPTENECLRFAMFLDSFSGKPTRKECTDFLAVLRSAKV